MSDSKTMQERLRCLRAKSGENQEKVAEACGISRIALARYEGGQRAPQAAILAKLAEYYGVTIDYLMGREQQSPQTEKALSGFPYDQQERAEGIALLGSLSQEELEKAVAFMKFQISQRK